MKQFPKLAALIGCAFAFAAGPALADGFNQGQHLNNSGQSKVSDVKAKRYMQNSGSGNGYTDNSDTVVNFGNKKAGTCNMNVGGTPSGANAKDVVVTAKNIINVCQ